MRVNRWMTDPFSGKETPSGLGRAAVNIQSLPSSNNTTAQPVLTVTDVRDGLHISSCPLDYNTSSCLCPVPVQAFAESASPFASLVVLVTDEETGPPEGGSTVDVCSFLLFNTGPHSGR